MHGSWVIMLDCWQMSRKRETIHDLMHAQFPMQELAMPMVVSGQSAVIAAETGSGKTLSYVAPIASMLLRQKERMANDPK